MSTADVFTKEEISTVVSDLKWGCHYKHGFAFGYICNASKVLEVDNYEEKVEKLADYAYHTGVIWEWKGNTAFDFILPLHREDYIEAKRELLRKYSIHLYGENK